MAIARTLKTFLEESKVRFAAAKHPVAYTAQEIAAALHIPGRSLAKSVLVKTDRGPVLAVLPAIHLIDLKKLKAVLRTKKLSIAKESDIKALFPDMDVGAMSPFGNLYGVPVVVDAGLETSEDMAFNAGSHTDTITLRYADFSRLVTPKTGTFGKHVSGPATGKKGKKKGAQPTRRARPRAKAAGRAKKKVARAQTTRKTSRARTTAKRR